MLKEFRNACLDYLDSLMLSITDEEAVWFPVVLLATRPLVVLKSFQNYVSKDPILVPQLIWHTFCL